MSTLPLPPGLRWLRIVCRLGQLVHDGTDLDDNPDLLPNTGRVVIKTSPRRIRILEPDGRWRMISIADREYNIRSDGELVDINGNIGVKIPDPASPLVDPAPYTATFAVTPTAGEAWSVDITGDGLPDVIDLASHASMAPIPPSAVPSLESRLASLEANTGSGVEEVAGVVTLGSTGPRLRQFYTLAPASIGGEVFPADTALVARRTDAGTWHVAVVDPDSWRPFESGALIPVTATAPTFTDAAGTANDRYVIPAKTGVEYRKGGAAIAAGTYTPTAGESVTITAVALDGYTLTGTTSWIKAFSTSTAPISVTATAPTWTDDTINGGGSWSTPTITGVTYSPASGTATAGQSVTVTATAQSGYTLTGTTSWSHTFANAYVDLYPDHQVVDTFDGHTGRLVTEAGGVWTSQRSTPKGNRPWIIEPFVLYGLMPTLTGGDIQSGAWAGKPAALNLPQSHVLVELDYTSIGNRVGVSLAGSSTQAVHVRLRPSEAEIYRDNGVSLGKTSGWTPPASGKFGASYNPTTGEIRLLVDDVERLVKTGPIGYTGTLVMIDPEASVIDNVRIKYL